MGRLGEVGNKRTNLLGKLLSGQEELSEEQYQSENFSLPAHKDKEKVLHQAMFKQLHPLQDKQSHEIFPFLSYFKWEEQPLDERLSPVNSGDRMEIPEDMGGRAKKATSVRMAK